MRRAVAACAVGAVIFAVPVRAGELVPFKGTWTGVTISAVPVPGFPNPPLVFVVSAGPGNATQLGAFTMESPHLSNVATFEVSGEQNFTAANGDTLTAEFSGVLTPDAPGSPASPLEGTLVATITGGTGRFAGATGSYEFHLRAVPLPDGTGYASTATIDGHISTVGSRRR